ncbi:MAG: 4Fe-4S binding protein [Clostridia bacterium]|nr:4Fe-4S binding protein [Clostridia bacterium]
MKLTAEQIMAVKGRGFLRNRGTENFSGRIVPPGTVFTAEDFKNMSELAERFGNGKLICTSRQSVEIPGIPYGKIAEAEEFAKTCGLIFGGTGAKVRPVTACKGTTCIYGNFDTQALAAEIHEKYYLGWSDVKLPHKFKIGVGGCPNSCIKPSLNDFGIEGHKAPRFNAELCRGCKACAIEKSCPMKAAKVDVEKLSIDGEKCLSCGVCTGRCPFGAVADESETLYRIYIGGTWGKHTRMGTPLSRLVSADEVLPILESAILWFKENGLPKERFGVAIDRVGVDEVERAILGGELLARRSEILQG